MSVRVLVVDDHHLLRQGLRTVLESGGIVVVAEAGSGPEAVCQCLAHRPDVVLMDVEMPGGDGLTATRRILEQVPSARVLMLTMFDLDEYVVAALRAGASGYLLKTTDPAALLRAVQSCVEGQSTLASSVLAKVVRPLLGRAPEEVAGLSDLTPREVDVLRRMAAGRSNAEIGAELYLAEATVKTHVAHILAKLGVRDRLQAVVAAHRGGLQ